MFDAAEDLWVVRDHQGHVLPAGDGPRSLLCRWIERGQDYHRPDGPVRAVDCDGRPAWEVSLLPPPHKRGLLALVVDDATGLCLQMRNDSHGLLLAITELVVDQPLTDQELEPARLERAEQQRAADLYQLTNTRPVPTPRWFPWRRGYLDHGSWIVETDAGDGLVSRGPLGQPASVGGWDGDEQLVTRLDHRGWSWAIGHNPKVDATARRIVSHVIDGRPYDQSATSR